MHTLLASLASCPGCLQRPPTGSGLCRRCASELGDPVHHPGVVALGRYDGPLAGAIGALKFRGVTRLAKGLARELAGQVARRGWSVSAVCPVPLHPGRLRQRGYNQAGLLAAAVAEQLGVPCLQLLERHGATRQQARLSTHERPGNTNRAFGISPKAPRILPRTVLLIDDVLTTGATLGACRSRLLDAGCESVYYAVLATASPRPPAPPDREGTVTA